MVLRQGVPIARRTQYVTKCATCAAIRLLVRDAVNLMAADRNGKSDPFVVVQVREPSIPFDYLPPRLPVCTPFSPYCQLASFLRVVGRFSFIGQLTSYWAGLTFCF